MNTGNAQVRFALLWIFIGKKHPFISLVDDEPGHTMFNLLVVTRHYRVNKLIGKGKIF